MIIINGNNISSSNNNMNNNSDILANKNISMSLLEVTNIFLINNYWFKWSLKIKDYKSCWASDHFNIMNL